MTVSARKGPCHWMDTLTWCRPSPPTGRCWQPTPSGRSASLTISEAGECRTAINPAPLRPLTGGGGQNSPAGEIYGGEDLPTVPAVGPSHNSPQIQLKTVASCPPSQVAVRHERVLRRHGSHDGREVLLLARAQALSASDEREARGIRPTHPGKRTPFCHLFCRHSRLL